jgi:hypothetical protein
MTDDEAANIMNQMIDKLMAEAIGLPSTPNRPTILRYVNGRFESRELDDAGNIIEPPARCPRCGPVLLCAEHMAMIT